VKAVLAHETPAEATMLYVGHFYGQGTHGQVQFTIVAESAKLEGAVRKMRLNLEAQLGSDAPDAFAGVDAVYLATLVEVKAVPAKGLVTFAQAIQLPDDEWSETSTTLPGVSSRHAGALVFGEEAEDGTFTECPFLEIPRRPAKKPGRRPGKKR
jgi:hypothetical protein